MAGSRVAVTGAFGFTGRALAEQLIARGDDVVTLSRRRGVGDPLAQRLDVRPLAFDDPGSISAALRGVDVLFNTYWLRFPRGGATFEGVVAQSAILLAAARAAGVRRVVHISVVGASPTADTPYVRAKAALEAVVRSSGMEWAIVRPTLTYGPGDILINNLAWALRRLPVFGMPGLGRYRVQPVHVEDVARISLEAAAAPDGTTFDAAGPETLEYRELVELVRSAIRSHALVVPLPEPVVLAASNLLGLLVRDVVLTRDEIRELTSSLLVSSEPARGEIHLSRWLVEHGSTLGRQWSSELARNYRGIRDARAEGPA